MRTAMAPDIQPDGGAMEPGDGLHGRPVVGPPDPRTLHLAFCRMFCDAAGA
jgi:hypothetical protein